MLKRAAARMSPARYSLPLARSRQVSATTAGVLATAPVKVDGARRLRPTSMTEGSPSRRTTIPVRMGGAPDNPLPSRTRAPGFPT